MLQPPEPSWSPQDGVSRPPCICGVDAAYGGLKWLTPPTDAASGLTPSSAWFGTLARACAPREGDAVTAVSGGTSTRERVGARVPVLAGGSTSRGWAPSSN